MADIPDQPVVRRVEHVMQRNGQFDDAEAGAEMSAGDRDRADGFGAQLVGHLAKRALRQTAQIVGALIVSRSGVGESMGRTSSPQRTKAKA